MKKLLTVLLVVSVVLTSTFATTVSEDYLGLQLSTGEGYTEWNEEDCIPADLTPTELQLDDLYFKVNGYVPQKAYTAAFAYGGADVDNFDDIGCFDLSLFEATSCFNVYLDDGNMCQSATATVDVKIDPFKNICCDGSTSEIPTWIQCPDTLSVTGHFEKEIPCGYTPRLAVACFVVKWDKTVAGANNLDAGHYEAMGKIEISVS
jgi:hypothetical protein